MFNALVRYRSETEDFTFTSINRPSVYSVQHEKTLQVEIEFVKKYILLFTTFLCFPSVKDCVGCYIPASVTLTILLVIVICNIF